MIGNKFKYYRPLAIIACLLVISLGFLPDNRVDIQKWDGDDAKVVKFVFKDELFDTASFRTELTNLGIQHSNIVYAQAKLETGNFRSKLFLINNNLFGFRNKKGKWMKFSDWKHCCRYYKEWQEKRYRSGDYYKFLVDIRYAEDTSYIKKVKRCLK